MMLIVMYEEKRHIYPPHIKDAVVEMKFRMGRVERTNRRMDELMSTITMKMKAAQHITTVMMRMEMIPMEA